MISQVTKELLNDDEFHAAISKVVKLTELQRHVEQIAQNESKIMDLELQLDNMRKECTSLTTKLELSTNCLSKAETDVEIPYNNFLNDVSKCYNESLPLKNTQNKHKKTRKPWLTATLLHSIKKKNQLYKSYMRNPTMSNFTKFKKFRNKLTNALRSAKKSLSDEIQHC